jgi:class 3 adenylate cyclase
VFGGPLIHRWAMAERACPKTHPVLVGEPVVLNPIIFKVGAAPKARESLMEAESVVRRLAAILAADIAGYSQMMAKDEEGTIRRLNQLRTQIIDPPIEKNRGRIVKTMGDGLLVEFASIVDAVVCSIDVQRGFAVRNEKLKATHRMMLRIGLHVGDVVVQPDGDLLGDGVNIAARLEAIAEPAGICLSEDAYRQVRDRIAETFIDLGDQQLKNIPRPMRVYAIELNSGALAPERKESPVGDGRGNSPRDKVEVMSLPREMQVRGPGFRVRLRSAEDAIRLIDRNLPPELATQPRWTFARALLVEAIKTGKSRDLTTATRQLTQALRNERWLVQAAPDCA